MNSKQKIYIFGAAVVLGLAAVFGVALAATPVLSVSQTGVNNVVRVNISAADPNSYVSLFQQQGSGQVSTFNNFGQTDVSGNFNQLASLLTDGSSNQVAVYVIVNGNRSNTVYVYPGGSTGTGNVTLSQTSLSLNVNQGATVAITNYNYFGLYYISSNSNSSVASAGISGSNVNVTGLVAGSTTIVVCQSGSAYNCANLYVTVSGGYYGNFTLSQSSVNLALGQNATVTASGAYNYQYYISSNSNPSVVITNVSGNNINLYGASAGSSNISVCQYNTLQCNTIYVTVIGLGGGVVSFSSYNPNLTIGQSMIVNIYNNTSNYYSQYYISSNSNPNAVSANISGSNLNLYGIAPGSSLIAVCLTGTTSCSNVNATVSGGSVLGASFYNNGSLIKEDGTIYQVYKNTKVGFANMDAFNGLGYSLSNVLSVGPTNLAQSSFVINSAFIAHPWGTWVKAGTTVYFCDQSGLIPISDYGIFLNNGGQDRLVVPVNGLDQQRPIQPLMVNNDWRLR